MMEKQYPESGCYGDGSLGHQHTRNACADALEYYVNENFRSRGLPVPDCGAGAQGPDDIIMALRDEMTDDANEEFVAEEWLNEHAPFTGAHWGWQDGDFGLWPEPDNDYEYVDPNVLADVFSESDPEIKEHK